MPIQRLGLSNPPINSNTVLFNAQDNYLVSVTASNKAINATPVTKVSIWVVPANAVQESQYAYIVANLVIPVGSSFETFRFAVNSGDAVYVRTSVALTSFSCNGVAQEDSAIPENLAQTFTNKVIRGVDNTLYLDRGTTAERSGSAEVGYTRFNTETDTLEVKTSTGWEEVGFGAGGGATGPTGPTGPTGASGGVTTFNALTDAAAGNTTIDKIAYSAMARLTVTPNAFTAYNFNSHYTGDNPTIFVLGGSTIAFNLILSNRPFKLQVDNGSGFVDISSGLFHVDNFGNVLTDLNAQGKTLGTLYWQVPITSASGGYRYISSAYPAMTGTITHKSLNQI